MDVKDRVKDATSLIDVAGFEARIFSLTNQCEGSVRGTSGFLEHCAR